MPPSGAHPTLAPVEAAGRPAALEIPLEARVVPDHLLEAEALQTAERIARGAPPANRWNKRFAAPVTEPAPITETEFAESVRWTQSADF